MTMTKSSTAIAFCAIGMLNNLAYVVMLAGAKSISEGGTALVFLANIMPGFLLKLSSPYWFDKVSYLNRMRLASLLMTLSFTFVGTFNHLFMQLLGVAFCSVQGDLGEASLLALCGRADSIMNNCIAPLDHASTGSGSGNGNGSTTEQNQDENEKESKSLSITAFAAGTGLAGPLGFGFVIFFTDMLGLSLETTMYISLVFPVCYLQIFRKYLLDFTDDTMNTSLDGNDEDSSEIYDALLMNEGDSPLIERQTEEDCSIKSTVSDKEDTESLTQTTTLDSDIDQSGNSSSIEPLEVLPNQSLDEIEQQNNIGIAKMSTMQRLKLTLSLWRFMIPLFVVYFAEYALQSGVWTAIGFPVEDEDARNSFYTKSNWAYQIGVFVSRSSGAFCLAPMWVLWLMPLLQCINLVFFYFVALKHFWYTNYLHVGSFYAGLLGGSVYVNGYMRVNKDLPFEIREFALSTVSVADSFGTMLADIAGLFIQSCLYKSHNISGAVVSCPI